MKRKVIEVVTEFLVMQMNHWVLIVAAVTILGAFHMEQPYLGLWIAMGLVPIFLFVVREKVHNFFLFFALHLMLPVVVLLVPAGVFNKLLMLGMILIYMIWSVRIRLFSAGSRTGLIVPLVAVIIFGALSMLQSIFIRKDWGKYYMVALFVYLFCYFIYYFMSQYLRFLKVHATSTANIPERAIFFSGLKQTFAYTAGGMLILLMTVNIEWLSYVLFWIKQGIVVILRFLFSLMRSKEIEEITETVTQQSGPPGDMSGLMEGGQTHIIWIILEKLVMVAMAVGLVVLIVYTVVKGYQFLWKHFHKERRVNRMEDEGIPDIREKCNIEKSSRRSMFKVLAFMDNRDKVRKAYRKHIFKSKYSIIGDLNVKELEYLTARECCDKISADALQVVYDKARYSAETITAEDVKQVKTAVK